MTSRTERDAMLHVDMERPSLWRVVSTTAKYHVVRGEDRPVMPVFWHSFELRPFDFFDRNAAFDLCVR